MRGRGMELESRREIFWRSPTNRAEILMFLHVSIETQNLLSHTKYLGRFWKYMPKRSRRIILEVCVSPTAKYVNDASGATRGVGCALAIVSSQKQISAKRR